MVSCYDVVTLLKCLGVALSFAIALSNSEFRTSILNPLERQSREQKTALPTECSHHWPAKCSWVWQHQVSAQRMKKTKLAKNYIVSLFLKHQFDTSLNINFSWKEERIHLFYPWINNVSSGSSAQSLKKILCTMKERNNCPDVFKYKQSSLKNCINQYQDLFVGFFKAY